MKNQTPLKKDIAGKVKAAIERRDAIRTDRAEMMLAFSSPGDSRQDHSTLSQNRLPILPMKGSKVQGTQWKRGNGTLRLCADSA